MGWREHEVEDAINKLVRRVCTTISPDCLELMQQAYENETEERARGILKTMIENVSLAGKLNKPVCQSPGYPTVYVRMGKGFDLDLPRIFSQAIVSATRDGYLRPSIVHPLTRANSGDNSGQGVPNFEYEFVPDLDHFEVILSFKGCGGAEKANAVRVFAPEQIGRD
jgi:fumarate hydratase subunit alpha